MKTAQPRHYDVTLTRIRDLGNETRHFELTFEAGATMDFIAGQFVAVLCPQDVKAIRRAYSIASPPARRTGVDLIIKRVEGGIVTNWFWSLQEGARFRVHGPFGKFILPEPVESDLIFVAVGTGIAPFRSMIGHLLPAGFRRRIGLLFGSRYDDKIPYHKEWLDLASRYPQFHYIPTISRPGPAWKGETGYVQTKIGKFFNQPQGKRVYICGLNEMIQAVQDALLEQGFQKGQIFYEKYD